MTRKFKIALLFLATAPLLLAAALSGPLNDDNDLAEFLNEYLSIKYKKHDLKEVLYVAISRQKLYHVQNGIVLNEFDVSTSKKGIGTTANSFRTPTGLHQIREKIGDGVPEGGIFKHRDFSGEVFTPRDAVERDDLITSRILWLEGMEGGHNRGTGRDSFERCIYIHGTHQEALIGKPASHGCIRMRNADVVQLFDAVSEGAYVVILNN